MGRVPQLVERGKKDRGLGEPRGLGWEETLDETEAAHAGRSSPKAAAGGRVAGGPGARKRPPYPGVANEPNRPSSGSQNPDGRAFDEVRWRGASNSGMAPVSGWRPAALPAVGEQVLERVARGLASELREHVGQVR